MTKILDSTIKNICTQTCNIDPLRNDKFVSKTKTKLKKQLKPKTNYNKLLKIMKYKSCKVFKHKVIMLYCFLYILCWSIQM